MSDFIETYKKARLNPDDKFNQKLCKYSTLHYFEEYIYDKNELTLPEIAVTIDECKDVT